MASSRLAGVGLYGSQKELTEVETLRFEIYGFRNPPQQQNEWIETTPVIDSLGNSWYVLINPGSPHPLGWAPEDYVTVCLYSLDVKENSSKKVEVVLSTNSHPNLKREISVCTFLESGNGFSGLFDLGKRADILSNGLDSHGTLVIDFNLQVCIDKKSTWYPKKQTPNPLGMRLFLLATESDITFKVGEEQEMFHAHKNILSVQAPVLYELVRNSQAGSEVPIPNVSGRVFRILLEHVYTGVLPEIHNNDIDDVDFAMSLLWGADRFGLTTLKLQFESEFVSKLLKGSNAADLLLFADGHACPLLKEACMKLHSENPATVMASSSWSKVLESSDLISELILFMWGINNKQVPKDSKDYDNMSVDTLREELESRQLDLDGTKSMLIQRLRDHDGSDNTSRLHSE